MQISITARQCEITTGVRRSPSSASKSSRKYASDIHGVHVIVTRNMVTTSRKYRSRLNGTELVITGSGRGRRRHRTRGRPHERAAAPPQGKRTERKHRGVKAPWPTAPSPTTNSTRTSTDVKTLVASPGSTRTSAKTCSSTCSPSRSPRSEITVSTSIVPAWPLWASVETSAGAHPDPRADQTDPPRHAQPGRVKESLDCLFRFTMPLIVVGARASRCRPTWCTARTSVGSPCAGLRRATPFIHSLTSYLDH